MMTVINEYTFLFFLLIQYGKFDMIISKELFPLTTRLANETNTDPNEISLNCCDDNHKLDKLKEVFCFEKSVIEIKNEKSIVVIDSIEYIMKIIFLSGPAMEYCFGQAPRGSVLLYLNIHNKIGCKIISKSIEIAMTTNISESTHLILSSLMVKIRT